MTQPFPFWRSVGQSLLTLGAMIVLMLAPLPAGAPGATTLDLLRRTVIVRGPSPADLEARTVGYYQGLLDAAATVVVRSPADNLMAGPSADGNERMEELAAGRVSLNETVDEFVGYRPRPNMDVPDPMVAGVRVHTNSFGFTDKDYSPTPAPGTHRIVLLGDSIASGMRAQAGATFEARLEEAINRAATPPAPPVEILNLSVSGYRLTQITDLALERAPSFKPKVYVLTLTWLSVADKWGDHLAHLVDHGIDLKYDALRQVVLDAGLIAREPAARSQARLRRFMLPTLKWSLDSIGQRAREDGAGFVVFLIPSLQGITYGAKGTHAFDKDFVQVRALLQDQGIPVIDVLDAFEDRQLKPLDAGDGWHPNAAGHEIIFRALEQRIAANPLVAGLLHGTTIAPASQAQR
jgi:hypothetical protein